MASFIHASGFAANYSRLQVLTEPSLQFRVLVKCAPELAQVQPKPFSSSAQNSAAKQPTVSHVVPNPTMREPL